VLRQLGVMISVGLADSLTPSTIGPALYLATGRKRAWRVAQFTAGFFAVNFAGGLVLMIGPGRLLLGLVPHPQGTVRHVIELVAGVVLILAAVVLFMGRQRLARRELPGRGGSGAPR
jgi:cytochrome c biogenesis protein CcdA